MEVGSEQRVTLLGHGTFPFYSSILLFTSILFFHSTLPLYSSILRLRMSYIYYRVRISFVLRVYIRTQRNVRLYIRCPSTATSPFIPREQLPMRAVQIAMRASCVVVALLVVCLVVCVLGQVPHQDNIIRDYFEMGFSYQLILCFLSAITYHSVR